MPTFPTTLDDYNASIQKLKKAKVNPRLINEYMDSWDFEMRRQGKDPKQMFRDFVEKKRNTVSPIGAFISADQATERGLSPQAVLPSQREGFKQSPKQEQQGFIDRSINRFKEGFQEQRQIDIETQKKKAEGEGNIISDTAKSFSVAGGVVGDVVGDVFSTIFKQATNIASAVVPDFIENPIANTVKKELSRAVAVSDGQDHKVMGEEVFNAWRISNPEQARRYDEAMKLNDGGLSLAIGGGLTAIKKGAKQWSVFQKNNPETADTVVSMLKILYGGTSAISAGEAVNFAKAGSEALIKQGISKSKELVPIIKKGLHLDEDSIAKRAILSKTKKITKAEKQFSKASEEISSFITENKALNNSVEKFKEKGTDVLSRINDPEIVSGITSKKNKFFTVGAVNTTNKKIDEALRLKEKLLPLADQVATKARREEVFARAVQDVVSDMKVKPLPKELEKIKKRIADQIEAFPDHIDMSTIDKLRSQARVAGRNAQEIQKARNQFAAIENATRDILFENFDKLAVSKGGEMAELNNYIKELIHTRQFLKKTLHLTRIPKNETLKKALATAGVFAGALSGGAFGAVGGLSAGGRLGVFVTDMITTSKLGNRLKGEILDLLIKEPKELKRAKELLNKLPGLVDEFKAKALLNKEKGLKALEAGRQGNVLGEDFITDNNFSLTKNTRNISGDVKAKTIRALNKKTTKNAQDLKSIEADILSKKGAKQGEGFIVKKPIKEGVLESINPTGSIFAEYSPDKINSLRLGKNITTLDKTMGVSPDKEIIIYRGAPKTQKSIVSGDFVTTNKQLAKDFAGTGHVLSKKVKASNVLDDITEPLGEEYIYKIK